MHIYDMWTLCDVKESQTKSETVHMNFGPLNI